MNVKIISMFAQEIEVNPNHASVAYGLAFL